jgi:Ca2+-binding EF-hand superfamily protein
MEELSSNPFATRLCQVFGRTVEGFLTFEEFLDMLSSLR